MTFVLRSGRVQRLCNPSAFGLTGQGDYRCYIIPLLCMSAQRQLCANKSISHSTHSRLHHDSSATQPTELACRILTRLATRRALEAGVARVSMGDSSSRQQLAYLYAGAGACFLAGWGAHAVFTSRRTPQKPAAHPSARPPLPLGGLSAGRPSAVGDSPSAPPSAASTPRASIDVSFSDGSQHKMALLVRSDLPQLVPACPCNEDS